MLGIKNRQLCHQELLDQKELEIADLKAQLSQFQEAGVRCTESVSQHTQSKTVETVCKHTLIIYVYIVSQYTVIVETWLILIPFLGLYVNASHSA